MKTLFRPSSPSSRWAWVAKAMAACAVTAGALHAPAALAAGGQSCEASTMQAHGAWNILQDFTGIQNGVPIADVTFSQLITAHQVQANFTTSPSIIMPFATGPYQTLPLQTFPGLGLRLKWAGYEDVLNASLSNALPPIGTVIAGPVAYWNPARFATSSLGAQTKQYRFKWKFELVVTDVRAYAGGVGDFSRETALGSMQMFVTVSDIYPTIVNQSCAPVINDIANALIGGVIALPELPKPPTPTCQFPIANNLTQSVTIPKGTTGSVPTNGASRAEGSSGERQFFIQAVNCGANSNYEMYFSDANAGGGGGNTYLTTTGPLAGKVNLRMYSGSNTNPIQFGAPPAGGSQPSFAAGVTQSGTFAGQTVTHPLTVQYVRAPGYAAGALTADQLTAQATVTVLYP
ncbi:hypothetical protein DJFAAGMI_03840 [Comamonas sp. PE63]|uniref:Fimbrial protein n=1 Tax=Comamonas brasiliensis TaxID=1812482 RepID=A0ABS5LX67_9BURK|nr:hypothetical protein [Comamonas sp. PE63]MBS3021076.1 hypothetical protein [Comamonas sp. PE63]